MGTTQQMLGDFYPSSAGDDGGIQPTRLQASTAARLLDLIRRDNMQTGDRLGEESLADRLGVSRTSVRAALRLLQTQAIVEAQPHRGFRLRQGGHTIKAAMLPLSRDEDLYLRIARDRVAGVLPESTTETDLMRRYGVGRHLVLAALALLSEEGIVHRGRGREWQFRPILSSRRGRDESYDFRLMLEPAALLLPSFRIVRPELQRMRDIQNGLLASVSGALSRREVFQVDAGFHELLASFSNNSFVLAAMRQQNRLRRLLEYQSYANAARLRAGCSEHVAVIDALLGGDRPLAARLLRQHLENARMAPR